MQRAGVPGLAMTVVAEGAPISNHAFGVKSVATQEPVTVDTVFEAASLSKPVFAYAVLKLCERGHLDLDAPLAGYLYEPYAAYGLETAGPRPARITPRHILSHTSGMSNWQEDCIGRISFDPGERFFYSGEGYMYLQHVVEEITGAQLGPYLQANVLEPFGMVDSSYTWPPHYAGQSAEGHGEGRSPEAGTHWPEALAAYSLYTTPADLARLVSEILHLGHGDRFRLSAASVEAMLTPQVAIDTSISWGLGWGLQPAPGGFSFWHWGDLGNYQAYVAASREQGDGVVIMANSSGGLSICGELTTAVLGPEYAAGIETVIRRAW